MKNIIFYSGEFWFNKAGFLEKPHLSDFLYHNGADAFKKANADYERDLQLALADSVKFADNESVFQKLYDSKLLLVYPVEGQTFFAEGVEVQCEVMIKDKWRQIPCVQMKQEVREKRRVAVLSNSPVKNEEEEENCNAFTDFTAEPIVGTRSIEDIIEALHQLEICLVTELESIADLLNRAPLGEETKEEMSPRVAKLILKIRDALALDNYCGEAYHLLYQITSPKFDKTTELWKDIEAIARRSPDKSVGEDLEKHAPAKERKKVAPCVLFCGNIETCMNGCKLAL